MPKKIENSVIKDCIEHCESNELVIVPPGIEDVGLGDYFAEKTKMLRSLWNLETPEDKCGLALRFPEPNQSQDEIDNFFESPRAFSHNRPFYGCFMIDISSYRGNTDHEYIQQLKTYMADNSEDIVFVLIMEADSLTDVNRLRKSISSSGVFRTVILKRPSPERISSYIDEVLGRKASNPEEVLDFFKAHPDFKIADNFIEYTKRVLSGNRHQAFRSFKDDFESFNSHRTIGY